MYLRSLLVLCFALSWLVAAPLSVEAGPLRKLFPRANAKSVSTQKTKAVARTNVVRRAPCKMVNGQLVCPTK